MARTPTPGHVDSTKSRGYDIGEPQWAGMGGYGMKMIQSIQLNTQSKEELLPGFDPEFPYIATCAELDQYVEPLAPWHWHRTVELFYMKSGCLEYTTPHGKWVFPEGSGGFVNANVLHTSKVLPTGRSNIQLLHLFEPTFLAGEPGSRLEAKYILPLTGSAVEVIPLSPDDPEQAQLLADIRQAFEISAQDWGYEFVLREALSQIWLKLFRLAGPAMEQAHHARNSDHQIKALMAYIHEHYQQPISVEQLAAAAHISKRACFRLFQENLHMTPVEYMRGFRLQKACRMLTKTKASVTQIAIDCGLGSSSYFGKLFRERFGCTPAQYRKNWHDRDSF